MQRGHTKSSLFLPGCKSGRTTAVQCSHIEVSAGLLVVAKWSHYRKAQVSGMVSSYGSCDS